METSPLICRANQWTGLYMITAPVMKELSRYIIDEYLKIASSREPNDETPIKWDVPNCLIGFLRTFLLAR